MIDLALEKGIKHGHFNLLLSHAAHVCGKHPNHGLNLCQSNQRYFYQSQEGLSRSHSKLHVFR